MNFDNNGRYVSLLSLGHLSFFAITGVRRYEEISTIYTLFFYSQGCKTAECDVIGLKNIRNFVPAYARLYCGRYFNGLGFKIW